MATRRAPTDIALVPQEGLSLEQQLQDGRVALVVLDRDRFESIVEVLGEPAAEEHEPAVNGTVDGEQRDLTLGQATDALGVSASTVRRWADHGLIGTTRTAGGHRRFRAADVYAVRDARHGRPILRCPEPPADAAPAAGRLMQRFGPEVLGRVAELLYERGAEGWFQSHHALELGWEWTNALASGLRTGQYAASDTASRSYMRRARLGGASLLECHLVLERFTQALVRVARQEDCPQTEVIVLRRLLAAVDIALLEDAEQS